MSALELTGTSGGSQVITSKRITPGSSNTFANNKGQPPRLFVENGSASPINVTFHRSGTLRDGTVMPTKVVAVAAGALVRFDQESDFPPEEFGTTVTVDFSATTDITVFLSL